MSHRKVIRSLLSGPATIWAVSLLSFVTALFSAGQAQAADSAPAVSTPNVITVPLEYHETEFSTVNWYADLRLQNVAFKKEPPLGSGKIYRGTLNFGGGSSNSIPFIWQRTAGRLILDLNRNQDFTDDPDSSFVVKSTGNWQPFDVHLTLQTASGKRKIAASLMFGDYGPQPNCNVSLRSLCYGKATFHGRDWQVGIIPSQNIAGTEVRSKYLLFRPWDKKDKSFSTYDSADTILFSNQVFVEGGAYKLDYVTAVQDGEEKLSLKFTQQAAILGEVEITGKYIDRLTLGGGPYFVVLDKPSGKLKIPAGTYDRPNVILLQKGSEARSSRQAIQRFTVSDKTSTILNAGGPLTNTVSATRQGSDLRLDFKIIGAGGDVYRLPEQDPNRPPKYAIYKDGKQIASGKFEFG